MQDLIDLISDQEQWMTIQPVVQNTFSKMIELFEKFNNKLTFIENAIDHPVSAKIEQIDKTLCKQSVKNKQYQPSSAFKKTVENKYFVKPNIKKIKSVVPQEMYLESNETMFAMVVEEIEKLKKGQRFRDNPERDWIRGGKFSGDDQALEKCRELEKQIQLLTGIVSSTIREQKLPTVQVGIPEQMNQMLIDLQRQVKQRPSTNKVAEIIKKQIVSFHTEIQSIEQYTQTNLASINKILNHQSVINAQICRQMKVGKWMWQGKTKAMLTLVPWQKQLTNLFPQNIIWNQNTTTLLIKQPGFYEIQLITIGCQSILGLIINDQTSIFEKTFSPNTFSQKYTDIFQISYNSSLSVSSENQEATILMILKKIY